MGRSWRDLVLRCTWAGPECVPLPRRPPGGLFVVVFAATAMLVALVGAAGGLTWRLSAGAQGVVLGRIWRRRLRLGRGKLALAVFRLCLAWTWFGEAGGRRGLGGSAGHFVESCRAEKGGRRRQE